MTVDINKLLEMEAKASKGNWKAKTLTSHSMLSGDYGLTYKHLYIQEMPLDVFDERDLELVCAMRNNIRELCLELKASRKVVEAARATLSFTDMGCGCDLEVNWICGPCALDKCLKELDGEHE